MLHRTLAALLAHPLGICSTPGGAMDFQPGYHAREDPTLTCDATHQTSRLYRSCHRDLDTHDVGTSPYRRSFASGSRYRFRPACRRAMGAPAAFPRSRNTRGKHRC